ncbi:MAG: GNAT family N-acetyltransferase [Xenococcaceae cyanobacterium MO_188.B29]|nr:GNAT family N-acetyltransferase [Xenococcaceae cyanobacterium MO_188.B29]
MIRYGKQEDLIQIDAFDIFGGDRQKEILEQRLQVYISENKVIGYISLVENSCLFGHPLITFLCVHPQYRRQKIASELLSGIEQKYIGEKLFISTESNNSIMLNLIKNRGYILSGSLSGLNDDGSDEVYFYKT